MTTHQHILSDIFKISVYKPCRTLYSIPTNASKHTPRSKIMTLATARKVLAQAQRVENTRRLLPGEIAQIRLAVKIVSK